MYDERRTYSQNSFTGLVYRASCSVALCRHAAIEALVVRVGELHEMDFVMFLIWSNVRHESKFHQLLHVDQGKMEVLSTELYT